MTDSLTNENASSTQQQSETTVPWFDNGDIEGIAEMELAVLGFVTHSNRENRELMKEIEILKRKVG